MSEKTHAGTHNRDLHTHLLYRLGLLEAFFFGERSQAYKRPLAYKAVWAPSSEIFRCIDFGAGGPFLGLASFQFITTCIHHLCLRIAMKRLTPSSASSASSVIGSTRRGGLRRTLDITLIVNTPDSRLRQSRVLDSCCHLSHRGAEVCSWGVGEIARIESGVKTEARSGGAWFGIFFWVVLPAPAPLTTRTHVDLRDSAMAADIVLCISRTFCPQTNVHSFSVILLVVEVAETISLVIVVIVVRDQGMRTPSTGH
ncbi:hypothetical protein V8F20_004083 [Naviculisporaceae sp. PSN 640]